VTALFPVALAVTAKMQRQEFVWDRDVLLTLNLLALTTVGARINP